MNVILILTRRRRRNVAVATVEAARDGGSSGRYTGAGNCRRLQQQHVHDARFRPSRPIVAPTPRPIPGGAIDVAARLTRTCHDTRDLASTCERRAAADDEAAPEVWTAECARGRLPTNCRVCRPRCVLMITVRRSTFRHLLYRTSCCRYRCLFTASSYSTPQQNCVKF